MNFFIADALAQTGEQGSGFLSLVPLVLIFVLFYFLLIRPQQKRAKKHKQLVEDLRVGDEVVTNGGVVGRITVIQSAAEKEKEKERGGQVMNYIVVETRNGGSMFMQRDAVSLLLPEGTVKGFEDWVTKKSTKKKKKHNKSVTQVTDHDFTEEDTLDDLSDDELDSSETKVERE